MYSILIQYLSGGCANLAAPIAESRAHCAACYQKTAQGERPGCRSHYRYTQAHSQALSVATGAVTAAKTSLHP